MASDVTDSAIVMDDTSPNNHCSRGELMGEFGMIVQGILGMIAFSTLMIKRMREPKKTRRSWTIWFYDTSKQGFGAMFIHFANILLAYVLIVDDPCTFYLISFILDSTIGLLIIYIGLKLCQWTVSRLQLSSLYFGEYGNPPKCSSWLGQCAIYIAVMFIEKFLVGLLVMPEFWKEVRKYMLSWIKNPHVEVVLVMLVIPFFVNTLMFWVVDNILMKKNKKIHTSGEFYKTTLPVNGGGDKKYKASLLYRTKSLLDSSDGSNSDEARTKFRYQKMQNERTKQCVENNSFKHEETLLLLHDDSENVASSVKL